MKRTIINLLMAIMLMLVPSGVLVAGNAYAACATGSNDSRDQVLSGIGETNNGQCNDSGVPKTIAAIVNILSLIVGAAAIIMIMLGGFKYITSGGESGKVGNAKNTLVYALIGLAIAALAQVIVHFVLVESTRAACPSGSTDPACQASMLTGKSVAMAGIDSANAL
jgi:hypothetical protein